MNKNKVLGKKLACNFFKLSPFGGDTNRVKPPWAVSSPPTSTMAMRQFKMHPKEDAYFSKKIFAFITLFAVIISLNANAQLTKEPELLDASSNFNSKRFTTVVISETALASVVTIGLQYLWYKKYPKSKFHFFDDNDEWLQMDKMGHATTAYNISAVQYNLMRWSGVKRGTSEWVGGATGFA